MEEKNGVKWPRAIPGAGAEGTAERVRRAPMQRVVGAGAVGALRALGWGG